MASDFRSPQRHQQNVDGSFYVVKGECMSCGAPELHAPNLMAHDSEGHCFFARQPSVVAETNKAIEATWASCCGAVRYGGTDRETLVRLAELGLSERCDFPLPDQPAPRMRSFVCFGFASDPWVAEPAVEVISAYLADFFRRINIESHRVLARQSSKGSASFVYEWGHKVSPQPYRARFTIEEEPELNRLSVQISRDDGHETTTAFAIDVHNALISDSRFHSIEWFTQEEWKERINPGHPFPY